MLGYSIRNFKGWAILPIDKEGEIIRLGAYLYVVKVVLKNYVLLKEWRP